MNSRFRLLPAFLLLLCAACDRNSPPEAESSSALSAESKKQLLEESSATESDKSVAASEANSLGAQLQARQQAFGAQAPADVQKKYAAGLQAVVDAQTVEKAVQVGQQAPDFELKNATGQSVKLSSLLKQGPVILMWYRGGWCPYCNLTLRAMQKQLDAFQAAGGQLVAISPELPDKTLSTAEKNELKFQVLSDPQNRVAEAYRVVFSLTPEVAELYQEKFQLHEHNGDESNRLPLAATYVIAPDGKVSWAFLDADYRKRAEPSAILAALKGL